MVTKNKTAFRNWFGLYCDNCGKIIPCLTNLTSYIILGLTFPIWYWFKESLKTKWLEEQKTRFSKPLILTQADVNWWYVGLRFGLTMFVMMTIIFPLVLGEGLTQRKILIGIPIWITAGLIFGIIMKVFIGKRKIETQNQ